jgi:hypothetical protein
MKTYDRLVTLDHRPPTGRNILLLGFWMRSTFVGAAFAAAGLVALIDPRQGLPFLTALTWIAAGSTFAWLAWQRTAALLDRIDANEPTQADRDDASPIRQVARLPNSSGRTPPPNRCQPEVS